MWGIGYYGFTYGGSVSPVVINVISLPNKPYVVIVNVRPNTMTVVNDRPLGLTIR